MEPNPIVIVKFKWKQWNFTHIQYPDHYRKTISTVKFWQDSIQFFPFQFRIEDEILNGIKSKESQDADLK